MILSPFCLSLSAWGSNQATQDTKTILMWGYNHLMGSIGLTPFHPTLSYSCGYLKCNLTQDRSYLPKSSMVLFNPRTVYKTDLPPTRHPWQRWVIQTRESPIHERFPHFFNGKINMTFTYHRSADIPWVWGYTVPLGHHEESSFKVEGLSTSLQNMDIGYAKSYRDISRLKTKSVLWFVSNCKSRVSL